MIELKNVSKMYGNKEAVHDLNLKINPGEIVGLIGPNGAGKSTTINMITGITEITKGDIYVCGESIKKDEIKAKKKIGLVSDTPDSFQYFTPIQYYDFIMNIYEVDKEEATKVIDELTKKFELEQYMKKNISELSHGTRQKVFVIGSLISNPEVWILDEPMTGLDPASAHLLKQIMKDEAKKGKTVLFSTHVLEVAEKLCDSIVIISNGKLLYNGTYEELIEKHKNDNIENQSLEDLFLEITKKEEE